MRFPRECTLAWLLVPFALAGVAAQSVGPPAQVAVSPSRFELEIDDDPRTESLTLFNFSNEPVQIDVSVASWDLDEQNKVRILEPTEQSLDQWLVVNPLRFSVPARKSQTVRFAIRPRVRPEPGEHRAMIYFDQVLSPTPTKQMRVKFRIGVAVYAHAGGVHRDGRINNVRVDGAAGPVTAMFDISSQGRSHLRLSGQYAIWPVERYPGSEHTSSIADAGRAGTQLPDGVLFAGLLPAKPVLPDTRREVVLQTSAVLPPGSYVLDLNGEIPGEALDVGIPFTVPHPAQVSIPSPE